MKQYLDFYFLLKIYHKIKSRRLKIIGLAFASKLGFRHLSLRIDPALSCNLMCKMCYFSNKEYRKTSRGSFSEQNMDDIARIFFPHALQVILGCGAEPTINNNFMLLLELAAKYKVPNIGLVTNGLLLREHHLVRMKEIGVNEIILSAHGLRKETYESFMTNGHFEQFIKLLDTISQLNKDDESLKLRINYTANSDNLDDLKLFKDYMKKYNINTIQVRPIMDIGGKYTKPIKGKDLKKYYIEINALKDFCTSNKVALLANTSDVTYEQENKDGNLIESIYTYISPKTIQELALGTEVNTLNTYKKRTKWYKHLLTGLISNKKSEDKFLKRSLKYDIQ